MLQILVKNLERFSEACHAVGTLVILPLMVVLITLNVVMRYLFNAPFIWGEEINGLLLFLLLFLSLTYAWDKQKHIRMEIVYVALPPRLRSVADVLAGLTGIVFFGLLALQGLRDIPYMHRTSESSEELAVPLWPFRALMVVICVVFVVKLAYYTLSGRRAAASEYGRIEREGVVIETRVD
jgi:TRAP-type C4-dicarboxylate transport system permease small subunit